MINEKQKSILRYLEKGLSQKEIAKELEVTPARVKMSIYVMIHQVGCKNVTHLVATMIRKKII